MPRHNGAIGAVGAVVLGGKFMGAALAEWETKWGEISKGGSRWRGGLSSWSGEIGGCYMWPPSIPPHKLLPVRTSGWDTGLRCLRRERQGLSTCTGFSCRSEFAQKMKVKAVRERREAVWVCLRRRKRLNMCLRRKRLTLLGLIALQLKWVMCSLSVSFFKWQLSLFVAFPPNKFGGNPCPMLFHVQP